MYLDKTITLKDTLTPMFITALLTIGKTWKQSTCPSTDEWIQKMWYIHTHTHTHTCIQWNIWNICGIYIYIYIYIYTHTHIYTHIYTHTHNGILLSHKKE